MLRDEREQGRSPEPVEPHRIDVFNKDSYGRVRRLVKKLGLVRSFRAVIVNQTPSSLEEMKCDALEDLRRQATRLGGDAIFLNKLDVRGRTVTGMVRWDGFAVRYNPGIDYERIMNGLRPRSR